jgi:hypothetical protein
MQSTRISENVGHVQRPCLQADKNEELLIFIAGLAGQQPPENFDFNQLHLVPMQIDFGGSTTKLTNTGITGGTPATLSDENAAWLGKLPVQEPRNFGPDGSARPPDGHGSRFNGTSGRSASAT